MFDERLASALASWPGERTAVVDEDAIPPRALTFGALRAMVDRYREQLAAIGVERGHLVPILARQSPESVALILALLLEGAAFCFLSERFSPADRRWLVDRMDPVGLVVDAYGIEVLGADTAEDTAHVRPILLDVAGVRRPTGWAVDVPVISVTDPVGPGQRRTGTNMFVDVAHAHFSSGSTGRPKAVLGSREGLFHFADVQIDGCALTDADRLLCIVSFSSNLGLVQIFSALFSGASLHLTRARNRALGEIIRRAGITGLGGSTPLWTAALAARAGEESLFGDVPTLRYISTGGLHMPRSRFRELFERLGASVAVYEIFGQAEVRQMTHFPINAPEHSGRVGSVGRAVAGSVLFVAVDEETVAPSGTVGEIAHCGPGVMIGYLGQPELTAATLRRHGAFPGRTVVYTGDLGHQDEDGYIHLKGRASRTITLDDGTTVWPSEVEDALARCPGVVDAVAAGVTVEGRMVVAAAVVAPEGIDATAVQELVGRRLPEPVVPSYVAIWPSLPTTPNGKPAVALISGRLAAELAAALQMSTDDRAG
jgi:acyl-CoA synthetase (AMP-forming)/AMP-acid ligase II